MKYDNCSLEYTVQCLLSNKPLQMEAQYMAHHRQKQNLDGSKLSIIVLTLDSKNQSNKQTS